MNIEPGIESVGSLGKISGSDRKYRKAVRRKLDRFITHAYRRIGYVFYGNITVIFGKMLDFDLGLIFLSEGLLQGVVLEINLDGNTSVLRFIFLIIQPEGNIIQQGVFTAVFLIRVFVQRVHVSVVVIVLRRRSYLHNRKPGLIRHRFRFFERCGYDDVIILIGIFCFLRSFLCPLGNGSFLLFSFCRSEFGIHGFRIRSFLRITHFFRILFRVRGLSDLGSFPFRGAYRFRVRFRIHRGFPLTVSLRNLRVLPFRRFRLLDRLLRHIGLFRSGRLFPSVIFRAFLPGDHLIRNVFLEPFLIGGFRNDPKIGVECKRKSKNTCTDSA